MGQLCSSEQIQHENKNSQRKSIQNRNSHYAQGNIGVPPTLENDQGTKPLFRPENDTTNYNSLYRPNQEKQQNSAQIGHSPSQEQNNPEQRPSNDPSCPICLESYESLRENPSLTTCNHAFCSKCLEGALKIHKNCPICLTSQSKDDDEGGLFDDFLDEDIWNVEIARDLLKKQKEDHKKNDSRAENPQAKTPSKECPICLEPFPLFGNGPVLTVCGHSFCSKCLQGALKINPNCPTCLAHQSETLYDDEGDLVYEERDDLFGDFLEEDTWNIEIVRARLKKQEEDSEKNKHTDPQAKSPFVKPEEKSDFGLFDDAF